MGIFTTISAFDHDVERATSENNTSEEWGLIMEICDRAGASAHNGKECLRAVLRRLAHPDPHVQVHAATLLDACVANCGRAFHLEVASRDFETEFRRLLARAQPPVAARLRALLRKWAEGEFRDDPQLDLIPSLHARLRAEEHPAAPPPAAAALTAGSTPSAAATAAIVAAAQRERDELARAIALSLREVPASAGSAGGGSALYPRVEPESAVPGTAVAGAGAGAGAGAAGRRVRALYDFEAAEDNELTFLAGETVHVTDSTDPNWWKGYNERGEGLFPANFVTDEPAATDQPRDRPRDQPHDQSHDQPRDQSAGHVDAPPDQPDRIDEEALDAALALLHEADPSAPGSAEEEARLARLEARAQASGALVDAALERADTRHARLTQLSAELVDALNLYHSLMRDPLKQPYAPFPPPAPHAFAPPPPPHQHQHQHPPPPPRC